MKNEIIQLHEGTKKIRALNEKEDKQITLKFHELSALMGLKEITPQESIYLFEFVKKEFSDFSFSEIKNAFSENMAGKLEQKVEPYGRFNLNYISNVLILYRKKRQKELSRTNKPKEENQKTKEQKEEDLKNLMKEVFNELNEHFKNGVTSFTFNNGIKFFGCLSYYNLMPDYKTNNKDLAVSLWNKAIESTKKSYSSSLDKESRMIYAYLLDNSKPISEAQKSKVKTSTTNNYKGLLVTECLNGYKEMFDNLEDVLNDFNQ